MDKESDLKDPLPDTHNSDNSHSSEGMSASFNSQMSEPLILEESQEFSEQFTIPVSNSPVYDPEEPKTTEEIGVQESDEMKSDTAVMELSNIDKESSTAPESDKKSEENKNYSETQDVENCEKKLDDGKSEIILLSESQADDNEVVYSSQPEECSYVSQRKHKKNVFQHESSKVVKQIHLDSESEITNIEIISETEDAESKENVAKNSNEIKTVETIILTESNDSSSPDVSATEQCDTTVLVTDRHKKSQKEKSVKTISENSDQEFNKGSEEVPVSNSNGSVQENGDEINTERTMSINSTTFYDSELEPTKEEKALNSSSTNFSGEIEPLSDSYKIFSRAKNIANADTVKESSPKCNANLSKDSPNLDSFSDSLEDLKSHSFSDIDNINKTPGTIIKKKSLLVEITYLVDKDEQTKTATNREIVNVFCEEIIPELGNNRYSLMSRVSDVSSGALADISKNTSPNSVVSGPGLLPLPNPNPNRFSTISNASTSSSLSIQSSAATLAARLSRGSLFAYPDLPAHRNKEKSVFRQKLTPERIEFLKNQWGDTDQLLKVLDIINSYSENDSPSEKSRTKSSSLRTSSRVSSILKTTDESNTSSQIEQIKSSVEPSSVEETNLSMIEEVGTPKSSQKNLLERTPSNISTAEGSSKKRKRTDDSVGSNESVDENQTSKVHCMNPTVIAPGTAVFARWTDKKYYSGTIKEQTPNGNKWIVSFDDGNVKALIDSFIIPAGQTLLKGQSVNTIIDKDEGIFDSGIIMDIEIGKTGSLYHVEVDKGSAIKVTASELFLTGDQAKSLKEQLTPAKLPQTPKRFDTLSLDNLVDGKRSSRSKRKVLSDVKNSPKPGTSGIRKELLKRKMITSDDDRSAESANESAIEVVSGMEPDISVTPSFLNTKGVKKLKSKQSAEKVREYEILIGPIPDPACKLFSGKTFLLTCSEPRGIKKPVAKRKGKYTSEESESGEATDWEGTEYTTVPFVKEHLRQQLITGGGVVYNNFEDVPSSEYKSCILIANRPCLTVKYIQSIAAGMKRCLHEWVGRCCRDKRLYPLIELPYGWSLIKNGFVECYDERLSKPFQDSTVALAPNADSNFIKFWKRVCILLEGSVLELQNDMEIDLSSVSAIVADSDCPEKIIQQAKVYSTAIVSPTWLVQCAIHGGQLKTNASPRFLYNYLESE